MSLGGAPILRDITWGLAEGEHWLVRGPNGAGKSTFLRALSGEQPIYHGSGSRSYHLAGDDDDLRTARNLIGYLSPEQHERLLRMELPLTVRELISGGAERPPAFYLDDAAIERYRQRVDRIAADLGIERILGKPMSGLSFGQFRRVLLARTLISNPKVLILDEFAHGLDQHSRRLISAALERAASHGTSLVMATHRTRDVSALITHELRIEDGRIAHAGTYEPRPPAAPAAPRQPAVQPAAAAGETLVKLRGVDVFADETHALDAIDWEVRTGEHWLISGPNGAGKSTLGKLLFGRLRAAHGGYVELFGSTRRRSVESLRRDISLMSDEEQIRYDWSIPVESVIASGFFHSVGLMREPSTEQMRTVAELAASFEIERLLRRPFLELSFGERRLVLVARALVRVPRLLILDEALNGFDLAARTRILARAEQLAARGTTVLVIGHDEADVPAWISHELRLADGRIVSSGPRP